MLSLMAWIFNKRPWALLKRACWTIATTCYFHPHFNVSRQRPLQWVGRGQASAWHGREVAKTCREWGRRGSRGHEWADQVGGCWNIMTSRTQYFSVQSLYSTQKALKVPLRVHPMSRITTTLPSSVDWVSNNTLTNEMLIWGVIGSLRVQCFWIRGPLAASYQLYRPWTFCDLLCYNQGPHGFEGLPGDQLVLAFD